MEGHKTLSGSKGYHRPVLLREAIDALNPVPYGTGRDAWYIDCTIGDGGHSIEIISRGGKVVGIDVDPQALLRVRKRFKDLGISEDRYKLIQGNFRDLKNLISTVSLESGRVKQTDTGLKFAGAKSNLAGAIFDLGVSSLQLETPQRGFSFSKEGPLDMRMDPELKVRALDLINAGGRRELSELFNRLGEEKYSKRLADALISAREVIPITTTEQLAGIVERAVGRKRGEIHPATRIFQALRIAVNDELDALVEGLDQVIDLIQENGQIVVISFHSLEDRIVKLKFKKWEGEELGDIITKKPIVPTGLEVARNPKSRSAKLRVFRVFRE